MSVPFIKPELIVSLGHQMLDIKYLLGVEKSLVEENKHIYNTIVKTVELLDDIIEDGSTRDQSKLLSYTCCLLVYQAIKQQMVCDELEAVE